MSIQKELEGITVTYPDTIDDLEAAAYAKHGVEKYGKRLKGLTVEIAPDDEQDAILHYDIEQVPFQRLRRITGYLVGTLDRWNNAKRAEEHDRVKHNVAAGQYDMKTKVAREAKKAKAKAAVGKE